MQPLCSYIIILYEINYIKVEYFQGPINKQTLWSELRNCMRPSPTSKARVLTIWSQISHE
jgi:hypothetical protein